MDDNAKLARIEFEKKYTKWTTAADVARWWDKWCVTGKTNHDRLGVILMHFTGIRKADPFQHPFLN